MSIEFSEDYIQITENGIKILSILGGIFISLMGFFFIWARDNSTPNTKMHSYSTAAIFICFLVGPIVAIYGILYKEKIYEVTKSSLRTLDKKSKEILDEVNNTDIDRIEKEVTFKQESDNTQPTLHSIKYTFYKQDGKISINIDTYGPEQLEQSNQIDQYIQDNYSAKFDLNQQLLRSKN